MTKAAKREEQSRLLRQQAREQSSALVSLSERWGIETEKLLPITKATIFKADAGKVSDLELMAFLMVCAKYDLNPFLRQIHAFYDSKRGAVVPIVGVDGWVDLINREKRFEGMEFKEHSDPNTGKLIAYTCRLYISGMRVPIEVTERLTECYRDTDPWRRMQHRMLRHKSLIQAGRYGFGISGIYDEDEGRDIVAGTVEPFTEPKSLQETMQAIVSPPVTKEPSPPPVEPEAPTEAQEHAECPGCMVEGMVHLEDCPNRPAPESDRDKQPKAGAVLPDSEVPASEMLVKQVDALLMKHGLALDATKAIAEGLTALEARMILSKQSKKALVDALERIEKARGGMF